MSTPVIDIDINHTLWAAWQQMQRHRVRYLPVCRDNKLAGLLAERQFLFFRTEDRQRPLMDLLASTVLSAQPDSSVEAISQLMLVEHLPAMPIVNDQHQLVGIVSRSDILRRLLTHGTTELWA
jgi:acetoin utilization protein AcuB